jgi:hypothetical protein
VETPSRSADQPRPISKTLRTRSTTPPDQVLRWIEAEARAHLHRAVGDADAAHRRLIEAAELFTAAGQPLDANRCLAYQSKSSGRTRFCYASARGDPEAMTESMDPADSRAAAVADRYAAAVLPTPSDGSWTSPPGR